jgi:5'-nucleotidase
MRTQSGRCAVIAAVVALLLTSCTAASETSAPSPSATPAAVHTILLSDDDGWDAPGITVMYDSLTKAGYDVTLVAPKSNQSGTSMSTTGGNLEAEQPTSDGHKWWVDGTPVDSIRVGLTGILTTPPDIVISGVNHGANAAYNVNYSGTVGAATAAAEAGVPAIAVSADVGSDDSQTNFSGAASTVLRLIGSLNTAALRSMATGDVVNVNAPVGSSKGIRVATQAAVEWSGTDYNTSGDGSWTPAPSDPGTGAAHSDKTLLSKGYTTLTVLAASRDGAEQNHSALDEVLESLAR